MAVTEHTTDRTDGRTGPDRRGVELWPSTVTFNPERIHAAAVYCSDGRMGAAFDDLLANGLGLERVDRVAIPGGPACLAGHPEAQLAEQGLLEELKFLVDAHGLDRVVLIQHHGCAFYTARLGVEAEARVQLQHADLVRSTHFARKLMPGVEVESWFLQIDGDQISFSPFHVD